MSCLRNKDHPDFSIFYYNDNNPVTLNQPQKFVFPFDNLKAAASLEHKINDKCNP